MLTFSHVIRANVRKHGKNDFEANHAEAEQLLQEVISLDKNHSLAHLFLGFVNEARGRTDAAEAS